MPQVYNTSENKNLGNGSNKVAQLEKLENDLIAKKAATTEQGQIAMIDAALEKVAGARKEAEFGNKITNNQARLGKYSELKKAIKTETLQEEDEVITEAEAVEIARIRGIPSSAIQPGQKFASMSGKEPSNISYMKTNIKGLFDLVEKA